MDIDQIPPLEPFGDDNMDMDNDELRIPSPNGSPTPLRQPKNVNQPQLWSAVFKKKSKEWSRKQLSEMSSYANKYDIGLGNEMKREMKYEFTKGMLCDVYIYFFIFFYIHKTYFFIFFYIYKT